VLAASTALLLGAYAHRVLDPQRSAQDWLFGTVAVVVSVSAMFGVALLTPDGGRRAGLGVLLVAVLLRRARSWCLLARGFRNAATVLWSLGLVALVGAEALLIDEHIALVVAVAATALGCAALARPCARCGSGSPAERSRSSPRLALLAQVQPWLDEGEIGRSVAISSGACAVALLGIADSSGAGSAGAIWRPSRGLPGRLGALQPSVVLLDDWRATAVAFALPASLSGWRRASRECASGARGVRSRRDHGRRHRAADSAVACPRRIGGPADGLWVLVGCLSRMVGSGSPAPTADLRLGIEVIVGGIALLRALARDPRGRGARV
jgi:hypothetical protein